MMRNEKREEPAVNYAFAGTALLVISLSAGALAQVPPDIAAGIRKIGPIVDVPNTTKLYAPLFQKQALYLRTAPHSQTYQRA
jgi:hypothetical protein